MKRPLRLSLLTIATALVALLVPLGSCRDGGPAAPRAPRSVALSLAPSFAVTAAGSAPIVAIRAVARNAESEQVLTSSVIPVDPNATSWPVSLTVPLSGASESVIVSVELLSSTNPLVVEWSGEVGPIQVKPGQTQEAENVTLGRGSLDNLGVTGVTIAGTPPTIVEGDPLTLTAAATGAASAQIFWASLDVAVATVDATGKVTSLRDGTARIVASAGTKSDTVAVTVLQRPASVAVAPDSVLLTSVGAQGTFTATVKDARGAPIAGAAVVWSSGDAAVAKTLGAGAFQAVANGRTTAIATSSTQSSVSGTGIVHVIQSATQLAISAGQSQTAVAGTAVATPPTVLVTDAGGSPVPGVNVTFTVESGGGSVGGAGATSVVVATNASGLASAAWKLGAGAGSNTLTASVSGAPPVTFDATATPAPPGSIVVVSGDAQSATVGTAVGNPLVVKVLDALGNPASGVSVTFAVASGGGSLGGAASAVVATDAAGLATSPAWTLGGSAGANTVTASVVGLTGVTFTATGTAQPANSIVVVAGGTQLGTPGQIVPVTPQVKVLDAQGGPAAGITVTFAIIDGAGFFEPGDLRTADVVTDAAGLATSPSWQLGGNPATNTMTATVAGLAPVTFTAETIGSIVIASGNNQTGTTGVALPQPIVVKVLTTAGAPMAGQTVQFVIISGTGGLGGPTTWTEATNVVTDGDGLAAAAWQLGNPGQQQAGANVLGAGLTGVVFTANASSSPTPTTIQIVSGTGQSATVGAALGSPLVVKVLDQTGAALPGATVTFTVSAGGGTLGSGQTTATATTDATGSATSPAWTLGTTAGTNSVKVSAGSAPPVTIDATGTAAAASKLTIVSGDGQTGIPGTALTNPLVVGVTDAFDNPVSGATVTWTPSDGTATPTSSTTDAAGHAQTSFTPGYGSASQTVTAGVGGLTSVAFTTTVTLPSIGLALVGVDKVSLGRQATVQLTLTQPAPAGGVTATVTSGTPSVLGVVGPGTAFIPAGQTTGTVTVSGAAEGTSVLTATAPPFTSGTLTAGVELRLISVPTTLSVPFGQTASVPITLARAAPAGGTVVTLTSRNPSTVGVTTSTVTIPAGGTSGNGVVSGVDPGTAYVDATNPLYDADSVLVTTSANLAFTSTTASLNASFATSATLQFRSNGVAVAAPSPGVVVALSAAAPACVTVPASVTIPTGLTSVSVPISYGGSAATPCTSQIYATSGAITPDTITATVQPAPSVNLTGATLGSGLQRSFSGTLSAALPAAAKVTVTSPDPKLVLVAPNATTPGQQSIDIPLTIGASSFSFYVQALDGVTGAVTVDASLPQYTGDTAQIKLVTPAFDVIGVQTAVNTGGADDDFYVRSGVANGQLTSMNEIQATRVGGPGATATITSSSNKQIVLVQGSGASQTVAATQSVVIAAGQSNSPTTAATGGVAARTVSQGTATITTSIPGFTGITSTTSGASINVTVTTPTISIGSTSVGTGLQKQVSGFLGSANLGGTSVTLTSTDPRVFFQPNATTAGKDTLVVPVAAGVTNFSFYVAGEDTATGSPVIPVTASAPGFQTATFNVTVLPAAFDVISVPATMNVGDADRAFYARLGIANGQFTSMNEIENVRAGGTARSVSIRTTNQSVVGVVTTAGGVGSGASMTIAVGQSNTPTTVASGGAAVRALANGTANIVTSISGATAITATANGGNIPITVNTPAISLGGAAVGSGLMAQTSFSLAAPAPAGGAAVTLQSTDSSVALLAPNATTIAAGTIVITVPAGQSSASFYVHGLEGKTGAIPITATAAGYAPDTTTSTIVQPAFDVIGVQTALNTLDADDPFYVRVGVANGQFTSMNAIQNVRFGAPGPLTVTVASSQPLVGGIKLGATTGASAQVQIQPGQSNTPTSLASGGVAFDPNTSGSTTISTSIPGYVGVSNASNGASITVNVTPPPITVSSATVGAGLQTTLSISLGSPAPAGLRVTITSSQPSVALVSPSATAPGAATFDTTLTAGTTGFSVYVQGVEGTTGAPTVTASAAGFSDGSGVATVVQPAIGFISLPTSTSMSGASTAFYVRVGIANSNFTSFNAIQSVRAGASPLTVTVTSSDPTVGQLVVNGGATGGSVTAQIAAGQSNTPTGATTAGALLFDPLAAGSTTVTTTAPGYAAITAPSNGSSQVVTVTSPAPPPAVGNLVRTGAGASP